MKTVLKVFGILGLCVAALFLMIVFGAKWSDEQAAADAATRAARQKEHAAAVADAIKKGGITAGMTPEEAIQAWGKPERKNVSGGVGGSHEQWVYGNGQYVYFKDGRLTSWQQSRVP